MKRSCWSALPSLGGALFARRAVRGCGGFDFEKMIERMPENAPPQVDVPEHQRDPEEHASGSSSCSRPSAPPAAGEHVRTAA